MTLGRCPLSIFCSRRTPPREVPRGCTCATKRKELLIATDKMQRIRLWRSVDKDILVFYCRTTSASTAHRTPRRTCCPCAYVLITVLRVSRSCEPFPDGFDLHLGSVLPSNGQLSNSGHFYHTKLYQVYHRNGRCSSTFEIVQIDNRKI